MLQAFIAAIFGGSADVVNKVLLGKMKLGIKNYLPFVFCLLSIISFFLIPLNFSFDKSQAFSVVNITIFIIMIISAAVWNVMLAKSMETEPLHEYEVIILISPLMTVILAAIFLPSERSPIIFFAGMLASVVLVISRFRKDHFVVSRAAKRTLLAVLFIAIEAVCLKILLNFYSPPFLYFLRVIILTIIFLMIYEPDFKLLKNFNLTKILIITSLFGTGVMVLKYYAFQRIGLVPTTIILLLAPVITYIASYFYFNEKRNFDRDLICAVVITACIIFSLIFK